MRRGGGRSHALGLAAGVHGLEGALALAVLLRQPYLPEERAVGASRALGRGLLQPAAQPQHAARARQRVTCGAVDFVTLKRHAVLSE